MNYFLTSAYTGKRLTETPFLSREAAERYQERMGSTISALYEITVEHADNKLQRILNEGLRAKDLEGILLNKLSVDEYVPQDPKTDNVVLAFFIKGVPEAVRPFASFLDKCNGVLITDFGDSETIPDTSVVYVECDRDNIDIKNLNDMMIQVSVVSGLKPEDFTLTFPNSQRSFPYSTNVLKQYFHMRTKRHNAIAQKKALVKRTNELVDKIKGEVRANGVKVKESMVEHMVAMINSDDRY